jgi:hypothetical protein
MRRRSASCGGKDPRVTSAFQPENPIRQRCRKDSVQNLISRGILNPGLMGLCWRQFVFVEPPFCISAVIGGMLLFDWRLLCCDRLRRTDFFCYRTENEPHAVRVFGSSIMSVVLWLIACFGRRAADPANDGRWSRMIIAMFAAFGVHYLS